MRTTKPRITMLVTTLVGSLLCLSSVHAQQVDSLDYEHDAVGAFKAKLRASGLRPNHRYQLTINGYKNHPSNEILKNYQNYQGEGYIDFKKVSTDANGVLTTKIDRKLPRGEYRVKLLIKDPDKNWLVVCSKDFVEFEVR